MVTFILLVAGAVSSKKRKRSKEEREVHINEFRGEFYRHHEGDNKVSALSLRWELF
jgi:hypothetical protein